MKYIILVGDGMGDFPLGELDGRTPLEAARTPTMDYLCQHGELLRLQTIPAGFPPGSDVANLSLLGYRPEKVYTGRAPLEAASMGVNLAADEIACRCNLVTLDFSQNGQVTMIDYSADHISTPEAKEIIIDLQQALGSEQYHFYPGISYRHLMVHKGELPGLFTVPPHDYLDQDVTEFWQGYDAVPSLKELILKASSVLRGHDVNKKRQQQGLRPANAIWLWGQGYSPSMSTLVDEFGISGGLISAVDLLKGIGIYGGLEIINVEGATGYLDTNYEGKAEAALAVLAEKDFVFVHVEAPDETGHQGLITEKIQAIEDFDSRIVKPIFDGIRGADGSPDFRLVIAMDHYTPLSLRTHVDLPVPIALYDSRAEEKGTGLRYTEKNADQAEVLLENGQEFISRLLERKGSK